MKILMMLGLTLFSFVYNESYLVEKYSCENNQIRIQYEQNWYDFSLFNVFLDEKSDICAYLEGEVKIEFEPLVKLEEPLYGYLFVNGELLQKTLIENGQGEVKIDNPNYKYEFDVKKERVISNQVKEKKEKYFMQSRNIAIAFVVMWILVCFIMIVHKRNKDKKKDIQSDENVV